jgi:hypothetical protein
MSMRTTLLATAVTLTLALPLAGCAHAQEAVPPTAGPPIASTYRVPVGDPRGTVHVMSLGPERLAAPPGQPDMYLHLRLAVENDSDTVAWTANASEQGLGVPGAYLAPAFAQASNAGSQLAVAPGGRGTLDLYYALPDDHAALQLSLDWRLHRGTELVAMSTGFEREGTSAVNEIVGYSYTPLLGGGVYLGIGPTWWYDGWGYYGGPYGWGRPYAHPYAYPYGRAFGPPVYRYPVYPRGPAFVPRGFVSHPFGPGFHHAGGFGHGHGWR